MGTQLFGFLYVPGLWRLRQRGGSAGELGSRRKDSNVSCVPWSSGLQLDSPSTPLSNPEPVRLLRAWGVAAGLGELGNSTRGRDGIRELSRWCLGEARLGSLGTLTPSHPRAVDRTFDWRAGRGTSYWLYSMVRHHWLCPAFHYHFPFSRPGPGLCTVRGTQVGLQVPRAHRAHLGRYHRRSARAQTRETQTSDG